MSAGAHNDQRLRGDLVRGSLWTLLASLVALPASFAANLVVVRALGPSEFAHLAVLTATYLVAQTVTAAGIAVATTQGLALARAAGDADRCVLLIRRCSGYALIVQAPLMVVVVLVALRNGGAWLATVAVLASVASVIQAPSLVVLGSSARNAAAAKAALVTTVLGQTAVAVTAAVSSSADVTWVCRLLSYAIAPTVALLLLEHEERRAVLRPALPWRHDAAFRSSALAFWGLSVAGFVLVERTEIFVLRWDGDIMAVAVFALATTVTGQLTAPMDSLTGPLAPTSAGLIASDPTRGPRLLRSALKVSGLAGAATCAVGLPGLVVLTPPVFGPSYGHAVTVLVVLGVASCLDSVLTPVRALAFGIRAAPAVLRLTIVSVVVDVGLALALIPLFGLGGAVAALCTGQMLFGGLLARLVGRRLHVPLREFGAAAGVALIGPPAVVAALLVTAPIGQVVVRAVVAPIVGAAILLAAVRLVRGLRMSADDLQFLVAALPSRIGGRVVRAVTALRIANPARARAAG